MTKTFVNQLFLAHFLNVLCFQLLEKVKNQKRKYLCYWLILSLYRPCYFVPVV